VGSFGICSSVAIFKSNKRDFFLWLVDHRFINQRKINKSKIN
jgi:hypothetical protein